MMLSKSNLNIISVSSRKPPTCTRCRNHGIYEVQLKGHRNLCQYKFCNCKHCILILERKLVAIKPDRQTEPRGKSSRRKRSSKKLEDMEKRNVGEALIEPMMTESLSSSFSQGKEHSEATFTNLAAYNPGEASNLKYGSANLPKEQLSVRPDCTNLTGPPHPYSCLHYSPRMRNFSPGAPPNITVGSPALPRMIVPLPDQPKLFLNFPATYHPVVTQGFAINSPPLNLSVQQSMEPY